ncbi:MAG: ABC transporter permease [Phycisphaerales bacterium]
MYQALLTRRYLTSKVMPLLASIAVALCTAMVLIVWSVMGGFLTMLLAQGSSIIGDAAVARPVVGFPHYDAFITELERRPEIEAATPTIETLGQLALPTGELRIVNVIGVRPDELDEVTSFRERLWWRPVDEGDPELDWRANPEFRDVMEELLADGAALSEPEPETGVVGPAMVLGIEVTKFNRRNADGTYTPRTQFVPQSTFTLSLVPMSRRGAIIQPVSLALPVANEYRSGMYDADSRWVFLPFEYMQKQLKLDEATRLPEDFTPGEVVIGEDGTPSVRLPTGAETVPARATNILIRAAQGYTGRDAEAAAEDVYRAFAQDHDGYPTWDGWEDTYVYVWEEKPGLREFINAVRKETGLVLVLFVFISFTAVFLVGAIFWSMVSEKTKDIGILRAVGAGRLGVAWLFVRYGLAIGVVGSIVGGALAWVIVTNINPIHEWLGTALGLYIWDPSIYYFTEIPSEVEPVKALIVLSGGVVFSALGALIPAVRAASMNPVRALRFE